MYAAPGACGKRRVVPDNRRPKQTLGKWESRKACVVDDVRVARGREERLRGDWPVMDADVIIVGAGPVGLMLAGELRLAGVRPLVLERQPQIREIPKAGGLSGQILELLRYRGELERFEAASTAPQPASGRFPWGGMHVDFTQLADPPMEALPLPQPQLERVLDGFARELGAEIRRGHQ